MRRFRFFITVALLYLAPLAAILWGLIPRHYRFHVMLASTIAALTLAALQKHHNLDRLGIRTDNLRDALRWNASFTAACALAAWAGLHFGLIRRLPDTPSSDFLLFYVLFSCPAQEFLFRSFLWAELHENRTSPSAQLLWMAGPFALAHLLDRDWVTFTLALFAGTCWAWIYRRHPNWIGVSLSHTILGVLALSTGLI